MTVVVLGAALLLTPHHASALEFIEPTSPLGGNAAAPINGGTSTQQKLGSLLLGSSSTTSYFCLNSDSVVTNDPTKCISSWSQLRGNYVTLSQTDLSSITFPTLSDHVTAAGRTADIGYARIQADGTKNQLYSLIVEATGSAAQPATALLATDGGVSDNYAAIFNGGIYIGDGTTNSAKKFCLNGTFTIDTNVSSATYGKGCITSWSQLATFMPSQNFVLLQSNTGSLITQNGRIAISGSATFATDSKAGLVIGAPPSGTSVSISCGDGMCNGTESAISCPVDCDQAPPAEITSLTPTTNTTARTASFTWVNPNDSDFAGVKVLRKSGSAPTSPFDTGATATTVAKPGAAMTSTNLTVGVTYYYTFYTYDTMGNYSAGVTQAIRLGGSSCIPGDPGCGPGGIID